MEYKTTLRTIPGMYVCVVSRFNGIEYVTVVFESDDKGNIIDFRTNYDYEKTSPSGLELSHKLMCAKWEKITSEEIHKMLCAPKEIYKWCD